MNTPETRAQRRHIEQAGSIGAYLQQLKTNAAWETTARRVTHQRLGQPRRNRQIRDALNRDLTALELEAVNATAERLLNHERPSSVFDDFVDWAGANRPARRRSSGHRAPHPRHRPPVPVTAHPHAQVGSQRLRSRRHADLLGGDRADEQRRHTLDHRL